MIRNIMFHTNKMITANVYVMQINTLHLMRIIVRVFVEVDLKVLHHVLVIKAHIYPMDNVFHAMMVIIPTRIIRLNKRTVLNSQMLLILVVLQLVVQA